MKKILLNIAGVIAAFSILFVSCDDDIDSVVTEIDTARAFSPANLEARVTNDVNVKITWDEQNQTNIASYTVEFYTDTINITEANLYDTVTDISPDDLPFEYEGLPGESDIYAQVKAISSKDGVDESLWSSIIFATNKENIFSSSTVAGESATLTWTAGATVTKISVVATGAESGIDYTPSETEMAEGSATIDGLSFETEYTATIYNNSVVRGETTFTTLPDGTVVTAEDDLEDIIEAAEDGETLLLEGGTFTAQGNISITKNLNIVARYPDTDRPTLTVMFSIGDGATTGVTISGIDFVGTYTNDEGDQQLDAGFQVKPSDGATLGDIVVEDCTFTGQKKSLAALGSGAFYANSLTINNCVVTDLLSNGGDFIDIRTAYVPTLTITNNTFDNCAYDSGVKARDFVRYDGNAKGNAYDDGTNAVTITFSNNTLYKCSVFDDSSAGRLFYTRWENNLAITCAKNIFAEMPVVDYKYPDVVTFSSNYYSNAAVMLADDSSGKDWTADFTDADGGDFTTTDEDVVYYGIGDPRWTE